MTIITTLCGGLGNQMFQYAAGRALSLTCQVDLQLDISWFAGMTGATERRFLLDAFQLPCRKLECVQQKTSLWCRFTQRVSKQGLQTITEPYFDFWPEFLQIKAPAKLIGYWQNEAYFQSCAGVIHRDFTFPPLPSPEAEQLAQDILRELNPVSVHIRRGDYVTNRQANAFHGLCGPGYYRNALQVISKQTSSPRLFIFTDDPNWASSHFDAQGLPHIVAHFDDHVDVPYHDMHLMSLCRHHIIANSSFSWWGAWLGERPGSLVLCPESWFAASDRQNQHPCPFRWRVVGESNVREML